MSKKILVTGGLGHIGSSLIRRVHPDDELVIVDNLSTQRYCSLFNINRPFTFLEKNFADLTTEELEVDVVIHLGAKTDAASSVNSPAETYYTNVVETKKLIDKVKLTNANFIFPSSTSVYGKSAEVVTEDDFYINPQSPYAESKIEVERYIQSNLTNFTIFRFATIYGPSPGVRFHTAVQKFCYEVAFDRSLTIWSDCYKLHRPYLGLNDAISAIFSSLENLDYQGEIFNVLTDNFTLEEVVETLKKVSGKILNLNFVDTPLLNQYSYKVNFDKIKELGFVPYDNLEKEIRKTLELFNA